jgi:hypothetical protein
MLSKSVIAASSTLVPAQANPLPPPLPPPLVPAVVVLVPAVPEPPVDVPPLPALVLLPLPPAS